jgi:hypothetical protein
MTRLAAMVVMTAGVLAGQGRGGLCYQGVAPGKSWVAEVAGDRGGSWNVSMDFGADQSFSYSVARGARTVLKVVGRFSMQNATRRAERWPSACLIALRPTRVEVGAGQQELDLLRERALFDGGPQTFRIDRSYGTGKP